ncbi:hypothetical protein WJX72_006503 [[Myrmecia] bisecta]|uniref:non-specific serine/threonine protein kinase n=1 Tax=[Myrmecia] bisecta TaxID=41462 RepID=A0AAW1PTW1_9CHLO
MAKKKKARKVVKPQVDTDEAKDELLALEAIYGEDIIKFLDGHGFTLSVQPHPAHTEANHVSVKLSIRFPKGYPRQALSVRLQSTSGLTEADSQDLHKLLQRAAAQHAQAKDVCAFNIIDACQDYLRERNYPENAASEEEQGSESLWHEMLQRDRRGSAEAQDPADDGAGLGLASLFGGNGGWGSVGLDNGLFDTVDSMEGPWPAAVSIRPTRQAVPPSTMPGLRQPPSKPDTHTEGRPAAATKATLPASTIQRQEAVAPSVAALVPSTAAEVSQAPTASNAEAPQSVVLAGTPNLERALDRTESSSSVVGSMLSAVRSGFSAVGRAILPPGLRKMMEGSSEHTDEESDDEDASVSDPEKEQIRRDMLTGHLLALATSGGSSSLPPQALPSLAAALTARGLMPKWVQWTLTQQPALFERAFQRLFVEEMASDRPGAHATDPTTAWALERFWQTRSASPNHKAVPSPLGPNLLGSQEAEGLSRYQTDFQELRSLGQGGFGLVVAAINRLDGRQYAVKKIKLHSQLPHKYARIMREVATLSRLQHPNVVRYFQAWCETYTGGARLDTEADTELDNWLTDGSQVDEQSSEAATITPSTSLRAPRPIRPGLATVPETSAEGTATTSPEAASAWRRAADAADAGDDDGGASSAGGGFWQRGNGADATSDTEGTGHGELADRRARAGDLSAVSTAARGTPDTPAASEKQQMLYIQMEFCPRTLQQVLSEGPMDEASCWQVVRQLLAGLAHIHSQGIIHRDLKPANIFYDAKGDIKLGDFGLAKFHTAHDGPHPGDGSPPGDGPPSAAAAPHASLPSEVTGVCGTSFYISPEIANGWARYDEKVDLYSLGVVAFELWHPFSTGMERAVLLRDLQEHGVMPADWEAANPQVAKLIRWLLAPNPADRPSAREVLRSEILPPTVGDEQLTDLLRSLPDNPDTYDRVVESIFSIPPGGLGNEIPGTPTARQVDVQDMIMDVLKGVFSLHGAVPIASSEVGYASAEVPQDAARMLAPNGAQLALRYELRYPLAAWLARQAAAVARGSGGLEAMRLYQVAQVRRRGVGRSLPRPHLQADLDIINPGGQGPMEQLLAEAEVIKAVTEILESLPDCGAYEIRISHRQLLEAVILHVQIPRELRGSALQLLAAAGSTSPLHTNARSKQWPSIRVGLEGLGLDAAAVARCKQFVLAIPGVADAALHRLRAKLEAGGRGLPPAIAACLEELQMLVSHLRTWGLSSGTLVVDPLLRPHTDYFSGVVFQVHLLQPDTGSTSLLAVGGRYDGLLKSLWSPAAASVSAPMSAVGVTLNAERLLLLASHHRAALEPHMPTSQAEVLVCARGSGGLLKERMALTAQLWASGLRAEMMHAAAPSMTAQYEYAHMRHIPWLVIIHGATFSAADTVKVKNVERRTEEDVAYSEVARYLLDRLHSLPHSNSSGARHLSVFPRAGSRPDMRVTGDETESDEQRRYGRRDRRRTAQYDIA